MARSMEQETIAEQAGFESYLGLMESSTPVATGDGLHWYVCPVAGGWGAWNSEGLRLIGPFIDIAAAQEHIREFANHPASAPANGNSETQIEDASQSKISVESERLAAGAEVKPHRS